MVLIIIIYVHKRGVGAEAGVEAVDHAHVTHGRNGARNFDIGDLVAKFCFNFIVPLLLKYY